MTIIQQWSRSSNPQSRLKVTIRCPGCRIEIGLGDTHTIADSGSVNPSVVCPHPHCDFHEFIQLKGWGLDHCQCDEVGCAVHEGKEHCGDFATTKIYANDDYPDYGIKRGDEKILCADCKTEWLAFGDCYDEAPKPRNGGGR